MGVKLARPLFMGFHRNVMTIDILIYFDLSQRCDVGYV